MAWEISFYAPADIGNYIYTGWLSGGIVKNSTNCDGICLGTVVNAPGVSRGGATSITFGRLVFGFAGQISTSNQWYSDTDDEIMIYIIAPHNENVYYLVGTHLPVGIKLGDINSYWTIRSSNLLYRSTISNIPERFVNFIHNATINKSTYNVNSLDGLHIYINAYRNTEHLRLKNSIIMRQQVWDRLLNIASKQDLTVARNNIIFNYSKKYTDGVEDYNRIKTFIK